MVFLGLPLIRPGRPWHLLNLILTLFFVLLGAAILLAEEQPNIITPPVDQTVLSNNIAYFLCKVHAQPKPQIEWRKNGNVLSNHRYRVTELADGSILRINSVKAGRDNDTYECLAENGVGEPVRAQAKLRILRDSDGQVPKGFPRFSFRPQDRDQRVEKGRNAMIPCEVEATPEAIVTWFKDGIPINMTNPRYSLFNGASLQILNSEVTDQGSYECVAENEHGTAISESIALYVKTRAVPPYFSIVPAQLTQVVAGNDLNLTCVAVGSPMPIVYWKRGNIELNQVVPNDPEAASAQTGRNVLSLKDIRESVNYTCVAASKLGNNVALSQVIVQTLPIAPSNLRIADVTPTSVTLAWNYDIAPENVAFFVIHYKPTNSKQDYAEVSGISSLSHTINKLAPFTKYEFMVLAMNSVGRSPPSIPIYVTTGETGGFKSELGFVPRNVQARPLTSSTIFVQWERAEGFSGKLTGYKIHYTTNPKQPLSNWDTQLVDDNDMTKITVPQVNGIYTIRVQALTNRGPGTPSEPVQVKTQQGVPSQPMNLRIVSITENSATLSWKKPAHSGERILGYELYWNDTFTGHESRMSLPDVESISIPSLHPNTLYYVWLAAKSIRGLGAATLPIPMRTEEYAPSSPPQNVQGETLSSDSLLVRWDPPLVRKQNGQIIHYKVCFSIRERWPKCDVAQIEGDARSYVIRNLDKWVQYKVAVQAGTRVGDGPQSKPILLQTDESVPGEPRNVQVEAINSTSLHVSWKPPSNKERNGIIRGYQIHLQELNREGDLVNEPFKIDVTSGDAEEFNVTDLQPDTEYSVQVAAVTRKGDGTRSPTIRCRTRGGVPSRPFLQTQIATENEQTVSLFLSWARPNHTFGNLLGYRLRYSLLEKQISDSLKQIELPAEVSSYTVKEAHKGSKYEFKLAASNGVGWGQEAIVRFQTPEGVPRDSPQNLTYRLQSPTTVVLNWDAPLPLYRNGKITGYGVQFHKPNEPASESNTTQARMVYATLDENAEYIFRARAYTSKGAGPWSPELLVRTPGDVPISPKNVQAMATSEHSVLVWWDEMAFFSDILGYTVLYTQIPTEDLDLWSSKRVPLTGSAELSGLEPNVMYAIRVAAFTDKGLGRLSEMLTVRCSPDEVPLDLRGHSITTHAMTLQWRAPRKLNPIGYSITYGANKQFVDAQGAFKALAVPPTTFNVSNDVTEYTVSGLIPFTSYQVNVTALPADGGFRPPARLIVTTSMAAPKPMAKPDIIATNGREINVALPQASEEYGPISHYYLVVVSADYAAKYPDPDHYSISDMVHAAADSPFYIAAKFSRRTSSFHLGNGQKYEGFVNRLLSKNGQYQVFVRAVVENQENLYTNSPFSPIMSLQKFSPQFNRGKENPQRNPINNQMDTGSFLWLVAFGLGTLLLSMCLVAILLVKRRGQLLKSLGQSAHQETTMKLLCANMPEMEPLQPQLSIPQVPDPVELRRLHYQTQAMMAHPPIPVTELANHIERLRENENELFSAEYESIDPAQQFTWEHSQAEVNKSKNRYANVIAYDHSRVILQPLDGIPGSDYINANYCDGYRRPNAYIATQGPLPETIGDFWRMVWEQRSASVVMMTKLEERTRVKCDQYWPTRGSESYGVMHVTLVNVEELSTYCIRTFVLQRTGFAEKREIRQFQFTAWPDHGVPDHPTPFLLFLRRVNALNSPDAGPMVIHCSAGVGRTGCFIVIDSMLQRLQQENTIDIYAHVTCLRAQRNYTVQTEDQYIFIYDAILEAVQAGPTEVTANQLYAHLEQLLQLVPGENVSGLDLEFRRLGSMRAPSTSKCIAGNLPVNRHKNRLLNFLPFEMSRVCLQPLRGVEGSDYINASFVDGYRYRSAYIAAQAPLVNTCEDFWRMLWEHNSTIVVMLTKCAELGREKCHIYWPCERSVRHLYFVIEPVTEYNMSHYVLREFKFTDARDGQSRTVRQFHFVDWPEQGVPKSADTFLDFITQVHKTKEQFGQQGPITVHCSAGVGRTGVFICQSILLERLQNEGVLDLFQTVRTLRTQRPGMVQTEDQYQFCYRAALEYISTFDYAG